MISLARRAPTDSPAIPFVFESKASTIVKLLRVGPAGQEIPCLLDGDGAIRDLSSLVPDIDAALLAEPPISPP
jgi:hypothetical protein